MTRGWHLTGFIPTKYKMTVNTQKHARIICLRHVRQRNVISIHQLATNVVLLSRFLRVN